MKEAPLGSAPRRAVLHVGTPKSGTTFLQRILWDNHDTLQAQGFRLAGDRQRDMFLAAVQLRDSHEFWGYTREQLAGRWSAVCRQAQEHPGTTILSHEVLGAATEEQVARAMAELDGLEVHVVLTARDLARQVTSEWQERIKNGSSRSFAQFQRQLYRHMRNGDFSGGFWLQQDPTGVLDRWAHGLPPSQVHVVVAPQSPADPGLLWYRFAEAVGIDATDIEPTAPNRAANSTLGVAQVAVLRHVNAALDGRIRHPEYGRLVKAQFAGRLLSSQSSPRPQCPPRLVARLRELAEDRSETIRQRGYVVHGDLADLIPIEPVGPYRAPDAVDPDLERMAYADAIASMLVQRSKQRKRPPPPEPVAPPPEPPRGRLRGLGRRLRGRLARGS
jgi:hypothetical protein